MVLILNLPTLTIWLSNSCSGLPLFGPKPSRNGCIEYPKAFVIPMPLQSGNVTLSDYKTGTLLKSRPSAVLGSLFP